MTCTSGQLKALHICDAPMCVLEALVPVDGRTYIGTERTAIELSVSDQFLLQNGIHPWLWDAGQYLAGFTRFY